MIYFITFFKVRNLYILFLQIKEENLENSFKTNYVTFVDFYLKTLAKIYYLITLF